MRLDEVDRKILGALADNARLSFRDLSKIAGVSTPTVAARVRRMEELGIILGYRAVIAGLEPEGMASRRPSVPKDVDVACPACKGPVHGTGVHGVLGGRHYAFCCRTCHREFTERFERTASRARTSHG